MILTIKNIFIHTKYMYIEIKKLKKKVNYCRSVLKKSCDKKNTNFYENCSENFIKHAYDLKSNIS